MAARRVLHNANPSNYPPPATSPTSAQYLGIFDDVSTDIFVDTALGFSTHKMQLQRDKRFGFDRSQVCNLSFVMDECFFLKFCEHCFHYIAQLEYVMLRMCRGGTHADVEEAFQRIFLGDSKLEDAVFYHAQNVTVSKMILEEEEFRMHAMRFASLLS